MQEFEIVVDFNGIVLFDPSLLNKFYDQIAPGENLYRRFTQTDDGEKVVEQGIIVPIIGINDSVYRVIVRENNEKSIVPEDDIIVTNAAFPFNVTDYAVVADMSILLEWYPDENWSKASVSPGDYQVQVNGFRKIVDGIVEDFGYEFVLSRCESLPSFTASLEKNMQVLELPD